MNASCHTHARRRSFRLALRLLMLAVALLAGERWAQAQNANAIETMNFDQTMVVDDLGRASIAIKMTLSASQFQNWQAKYGQNKSLLRRDMNKLLSMYDTYDWDVAEKQMDREITVTLKARGAVVNKGRGVQEFRVPKEWRGGERRDNTFTFNYVEGLAPGVVGQFNVKLTAPENASDFREQLSEGGEKVIQYSLPVPGKSSWMLTAGLLSLLLGTGLVGAAFMGKAAPARRAASRPAAQPTLKHSKSADPPSMSTIPLEMTETSDRSARRSN